MRSEYFLPRFDIVSVGIIILDETVSDGLLALIGSSWMIGASLQIAAGIIARNYGTAEDAK